MPPAPRSAPLFVVRASVMMMIMMMMIQTPGGYILQRQCFSKTNPFATALCSWHGIRP